MGRQKQTPTPVPPFIIGLSVSDLTVDKLRHPNSSIHRPVYSRGIKLRANCSVSQAQNIRLHPFGRIADRREKCCRAVHLSGPATL